MSVAYGFCSVWTRLILDGSCKQTLAGKFWGKTVGGGKLTQVITSARKNSIAQRQYAQAAELASSAVLRPRFATPLRPLPGPIAPALTSTVQEYDVKAPRSGALRPRSASTTLPDMTVVSSIGSSLPGGEPAAFSGRRGLCCPLL